MKNEERILELLAETLQRIDRHSEQFERINERIELINERIERISERIESHQEQIDEQSEHRDEQREQIWTLIAQIQKHQERLDQHEGALVTLKERDEVIHQSLLEQQKAYQAMTELLLHHNRILTAKGIL